MSIWVSASSLSSASPSVALLSLLSLLYDHLCCIRSAWGEIGDTILRHFILLQLNSIYLDVETAVSILYDFKILASNKNVKVTVEALPFFFPKVLDEPNWSDWLTVFIFIKLLTGSTIADTISIAQNMFSLPIHPKDGTVPWKTLWSDKLSPEYPEMAWLPDQLKKTKQWICSKT